LVARYRNGSGLFFALNIRETGIHAVRKLRDGITGMIIDHG